MPAPTTSTFEKHRGVEQRLPVEQAVRRRDVRLVVIAQGVAGYGDRRSHPNRERHGRQNRQRGVTKPLERLSVHEPRGYRINVYERRTNQKSVRWVPWIGLSSRIS